MPEVYLIQYDPVCYGMRVWQITGIPGLPTSPSAPAVKTHD